MVAELAAEGPGPKPAVESCMEPPLDTSEPFTNTLEPPGNSPGPSQASSEFSIDFLEPRAPTPIETATDEPSIATTESFSPAAEPAIEDIETKPDTSDERFSYRALDASTDSLRLLHIEPSSDEDAPLRCSISEVTVGKRPRYKAISYMWGDDTVKRKIFLHDREFLVSTNLHDALRFLRGAQEGTPLWIDAICINQEDIPERSWQVRMMPHIYFRAMSVVVWLGQEALNSCPKVDFHKQEVWDASAVVHNDYWDRVWIIQEIGKARHLEVCLHNELRPWNSLIQGLDRVGGWQDLSGGQDLTGPRRLQQQLERKYSGGHTLRTLIETHRNSKCQDPRDKVYGLVGLASDGYRFPIDYSKTLYEVWKDTLVFLYNIGSLPSDEVVSFAKSLEIVLGSVEIANSRIIAASPRRNSIGPTAPMACHAQEVGIRAYLAGNIKYLGPSPETLVKSLREFDRWTDKVQQNYPESAGEANRENDMLIERLLEDPNMDASRLKVFSSSSREFPLAADFHTSENTSQDDEPCLFQLENFTRRRFGIAPRGSQLDDSIYIMDHMPDPIISRKEDGSQHAFGTAIWPHGQGDVQSFSMWPLAGVELKFDVDVVYTIISQL